MRVNNKAEFRKLQAEWYKKLSDSGFSDAEVFIPKTGFLRLKRPCGDISRHFRQSTLHYYQNCDIFHTYGTFKSDLHRQIWEYHANGLSLREIEAELDKQDIKIYYSRLCYIIKDMQKAMEIFLISYNKKLDA